MDTGRAPFAEMTVERNGRSARVKVVLNRYPVPVPAMLSECPDTAYFPYSRCTRNTLPDGSSLVQDHSPQDAKNPSGPELLTVRLTGKDGRHLSVSETGAPKARTAGAATSGLPLTPEELTSVVTSPVWQPVLASMPSPPPGPQTGSVSRLTGKQISGLIEQLLPEDLRPAQAGGTDGFGHVVVDDGRGESLIAANVQHWKPTDRQMTTLFEKADTLADGTRVSVRKGPATRGGEGTVEWSVDTFRDDGLRVVVSALNAPAYPLPATRHNPALDSDQLKQIALSPTWRDAVLN